MGQFLLLLHERPADLADVSPSETQRIIRDYSAWRDSLIRDQRLVGSNKLCDEGGKQLVKDGQTRRVTDGPYTEAKEVIAGYFLIEADDYDQAVGIARSCPHLDYGRIEVRRVDLISGCGVTRSGVTP